MQDCRYLVMNISLTRHFWDLTNQNYRKNWLLKLVTQILNLELIKKNIWLSRFHSVFIKTLVKFS